MKAITWAVSFLLSLMILSITGCPTCVGRMNKSDAPFFSDDFHNKLTLPYTSQPGEDEEISHIEDAEDSGGDSEDLGEPL